MIARLRRVWIRLTYWQVKCDGCAGTGICTGRNSQHPHSCCGECGRRSVPLSEVPPGFSPVLDGQATIGDGIMWVRPWAPRRQVHRPRST